MVFFFFKNSPSLPKSRAFRKNSAAKSPPRGFYNQGRLTPITREEKSRRLHLDKTSPNKHCHKMIILLSVLLRAHLSFWKANDLFSPSCPSPPPFPHEDDIEVPNSICLLESHFSVNCCVHKRLKFCLFSC